MSQLLLLIAGFFKSLFTFSPSLPSPTSTPTPAHPYAISELSSRVDSATQITISQTLLGTTRFSSYIVNYISDNFKLNALMHVPKGQSPPAGWPVVIVNHGYIPPDQYSTVNSYKNTSAYYANSGFLVIKPDYRGHDKSEGESSRPLSRSQYALDVLNLVAGVSSLESADPRRIFLYGHSMGGDVSLIVAQVNSNIKGISLWAPAVTSYPESIDYFTRRRRPTPTGIEAVITATQDLITRFGSAAFSSYDNTSRLKAPLIIHHGTADESVPYQWGENLANKLKTEAKTVTFYSYPGANHDITSAWSTALSRDLVFFQSLLGQ